MDKTKLPFLITDYYKKLLDLNNPDDPLTRQILPNSNEDNVTDKETLDPLKEEQHTFTQRLIHRYANRVAFLATDTCAQYCRHCFRRRFTGKLEGPATDKQVEDACKYLKENKKICELLFTGGDPLTMTDELIEKMLASFREARKDLIIRICTRIPVVQPDRITDNLILIFKKLNTAPFFLLTQFNHPQELTKESVAAVSKFTDAGIPAFNQTVLLKGVNDNADVLEVLCNKLLFSKIKPYYLFQGDLVSGTEEFRVPLQKGLEIEKHLRKRLSGLALPAYTIDLPEGGGKVPLCGSYLEGQDKDGNWVFRTLEGEKRYYPDPHQVCSQ